MRSVLLAAIFLVPGTAFAAAEQLRELQLTSMDILKLEFVPTAMVGDPKVIDVQPGANNTLRVTAKTLGSSTLVLYDNEGNLQHRFSYQVVEAGEVAKPDPRLEGLRKLLRKMPQLTVRMEDGEIVIEGEVDDPAHAERLDAIVGAYPNIRDRTIRAR